MNSLLNTLQDYTHPGGGSISTRQDQDIDKHDDTAHTTMLSNAECIQLLAEQINQLVVAVQDLHSKIDTLQEEKSTPSGCGFLCAHNSLNL